MKATTLIVGILLIAFGLGTLAYEGYMTFSSKPSMTSTPEGQVPAGTKTTIPLRPITGGLALVCGFVLVLVSNKRPVDQ